MLAAIRTGAIRVAALTDCLRAVFSSLRRAISVFRGETAAGLFCSVDLSFSVATPSSCSRLSAACTQITSRRTRTRQRKKSKKLRAEIARLQSARKIFVFLNECLDRTARLAVGRSRTSPKPTHLGKPSRLQIGTPESYACLHLPASDVVPTLQFGQQKKRFFCQAFLAATSGFIPGRFILPRALPPPPLPTHTYTHPRACLDSEKKA